MWQPGPGPGLRLSIKSGVDLEPGPCPQQYKQTRDNSSSVAVHLPDKGVTAIPARGAAAAMLGAEAWLSG